MSVIAFWKVYCKSPQGVSNIFFQISAKIMKILKKNKQIRNKLNVKITKICKSKNFILLFMQYFSSKIYWFCQLQSIFLLGGSCKNCQLYDESLYSPWWSPLPALAFLFEIML